MAESRASARSRRNNPTLASTAAPPHQRDLPGGSRLSRREALALLALGGLSLLVYLVTCVRTLAGGDSGELAVAAARFSVAHPPGYPLYVTLGKVATLLPVGSVALRLNVFSALCGAGAVVLLAASLRLLTGRMLPGVVAGVCFGFSPLVWSWATRAEVFSLNNLCAGALLLLSARVAQQRTARSVHLFAFVFGLGLGNHLTLVLVGAPLGLACLYLAREQLGFRSLLSGAAAFVGGLLIYLQLPLGEAVGRGDAWGDTGTVEGFVRHVLRADYGTLRLAAAGAVGEGSFGQTFTAFVFDHVRQLLFVGVLLAGYGCAVSLRQRQASRPIVVAMMASWLLCAFGFNALARFPAEDPLLLSVLRRFWQLPLLAGFFLAGLGLHALGQRMGRPRVLFALAVALCSSQLGVAMSDERLRRQRDDVLVEEYGRALLASLPERAVLLVRGDVLSNSARYLIRAEHVREDVQLLDVELLTYPWYVRAHSGQGVVFPGARYGGDFGQFVLSQLVAANPERPFFYVGEMKSEDQSLAGQLVPHALARRIAPRGVEEPTFVEAQMALDALDGSAFGRAVAARVTPSDLWSVAVVQEYWEAHHRLALGKLLWALSHGNDRPTLEATVRDLEALIARHPDAPWAYFKNLGIAHGALGDLQRRTVALERYLKTAPADEPDRAAVEAELRARSR